MTERRRALPPGWLQGAWRRTGRQLGRHDGPDDVEEVSDILWIQAGAYFADVRVARTDSCVLSELDQTQAFSGTVVYDRPVVTWRHDLDTMGRPAGYEDRAEVEPQGHDRLFERALDYLEVWQRDGDADVATTVLEKHHGQSGATAARVIRAGDLVACVWAIPEPGGAAVLHEDGGWDVMALVGPDSIPWPAVTAAPTGRPPAGWHRVA